jgi:hypothetical protein
VADDDLSATDHLNPSPLNRKSQLTRWRPTCRQSKKPRGLMLRVVYLVARRMFGNMPTGTQVFTARMPGKFMNKT